MTHHRLTLRQLLLMVVAGCSTDDSQRSSLPSFVVTEAFVTPIAPQERKPSLDSPAIWMGPGGKTWIVVTAKRGNQLHVLDAASGDVLRTVGREGPALGEFRRPNGIAIVGDLILVVERDNKRVQVLRAPDFEPVTAFGAETLSRPYGIAVLRHDSTNFEIFVTEQYRGLFGLVPRDNDLGQRVKRFRVAVADGQVVATYIGAFGDTIGPGRLLRVESLAADPDAGILLIADEIARDVKVYRTDGSFTGRVLGGGVIRHEPEGIALYACGSDDGYWIVTDQHHRENRFLVFRRSGFELLGSFTGAVVTNTDGIVVLQRKLGAMAAGAMFAVHDDRSLGAFSWSDVAARLNFRAGCTSQDAASVTIPS